MTSSSMPEQEHRRSPPETVTMASDEPQPQLPASLHPATGRSDVATMVTTGGGAGVMGAEGRLGDGVLIVGMPGGQLLLAPTPLSSMKQEKEVSAHPCPENMPAAAANGEKQCVECGATETPQWRIHPTGQGALCCNACRIRLRPAEALREPVRVHLPPPATATTVIPESPAAGGWISESEVGMDSDAYLLTASEEKKEKRKRKPYHPWKSSSKQCHHCKSASTPQWRMGPTGPSTLCNACGVRYRDGRLMEEYGPAASPNFEPSEHACKHREVLQLRQKKQRGKGQQQQPPQPAAMQPRAGGMEQQHQPPPPAQAHAGDDGLLMGEGEPNPLGQLLLDIDGSPETHILCGVGGDLDEFLFSGPAAPPLIDDDDDEDLVD